ncbi:HAMP domain-containing protein [Candidatus Poribacteria bacterium]|nr:HAMP domain-containing protein [Candidatus Poribacteria bacterium]
MADARKYPTFDPREYQSDRHPPPVRGSLRRRVMVLLIIVTVLPALGAVALMWLTASGTIRYAARDQTFGMARRLSVETDRLLAKRISSVQQLASDNTFARSVRAHVESMQAVGMPSSARRLDQPLGLVSLGLEGTILYLADSRGKVLAQVYEDRVSTGVDRPTKVDTAPAMAALRGTLPAGPFLAEPDYVDEADPRFIIGVPLAIGDPSASAPMPLLLVAAVPLSPLCQTAEQVNPAFGQRLVLVSRQLGVIHQTQKDRDFETALNGIRERFFQTLVSPGETGDLEMLTIRGLRLGFAHSEVRTAANASSHPGLPKTQWIIIQSVDMEEVLASLDRQLWTAAIVGIALSLAAVLLSIWVSSRVVRPMLQLTEGMQRFAQGELQYRVDVRTGDEIEVLAHAANDMASSLRKLYNDLALRMEELDEKARQLELIYSISHSVNRVLDLDELFERLIKEIREQVPCERLSLGLLHTARDVLTLDYVYPADRLDLPRGTHVPLKTSVAGKALKDQLLTIRRLREDGGYFEDKALVPAGMKVACVLPLIATDGPVGTLNIATTEEGRLGRREIKILERVAESLALAVEHSRLYTRVARFAQELEETVEKRTEELKVAQQKLVQTEKFAATGSIAAHIAHEVNNPLSIIKNYLKILTSQLKRAGDAASGGIGEATANLHIIEEEIDRIARIVSQLRQVSKPSKPVSTPVDLPEEIQKLVNLFEGTLHKRRIEIEVETDPELRTVILCGDYFRQILINLLRNSMDAMEEEGGIITIRTRRASESPDTYYVEIQDTGSGIPEDHLAKIFDPFFTTKTEGKGTGLGLSVSYGLAQTMGGLIEVESTVSVGTLMRLVLPLTPTLLEEKEGAEYQVPEEIPGTPPPPVRRRGKRIIIG